MPSRHEELAPSIILKNKRSWRLRDLHSGKPNTPEPASSNTNPPNDTPRVLFPLQSMTMNTLQLVTSSSRDRLPTNQTDAYDGTTPARDRTEHLSQAASPARLNGHPQSERLGPNTSHANSALSPTSAIQSVRSISTEFERPSDQLNLPIAEDATAEPDSSLPPFDASVGRATTGKTGKIIEKLMGDNDKLRRDIRVERARAEESRIAVRMAEGRMEQLIDDYDSRLHDAAVNKTLLKRRERQVTELKLQVESERAKANAAVEREKGWRSQMEKMVIETQAKVAEATNKAMLFETRYSTLEKHWKDEDAKVKRHVDKARDVTQAVLKTCKDEAEKVQLLEEVHAQHVHHVEKMGGDNAAIAAAFIAYKKEQDDALAEIKNKAAEQDKLFKAKMEEADAVVGQLKWALNVQQNVNNKH